MNGDGYDDVIVSSASYDKASTNGAAFVFLGSASGIASGTAATNADREIPSEQSGSYFGSSIAGVGDINRDGADDVIIGAPLYRLPKTR